MINSDIISSTPSQYIERTQNTKFSHSQFWLKIIFYNKNISTGRKLRNRTETDITSSRVDSSEVKNT